MKKHLWAVILTICLLLQGMTAFAADNDHPFTDVDADSYYADAVQFVYDEGLMSGMDTTQFAPDSTMTRGMIVTILWRMEGSPKATGKQFSDVASDAYYADAVLWAAENDLVLGNGDDTYTPDKEITRECMALVLYRYADYIGFELTEKADLEDYADVDTISSYAKEAFTYLCGSGLFSGIGDDLLSPKGSATRAQIAVLLQRFCDTVDAGSTGDKDAYTVTFKYNYGKKGTYETLTVKTGETVDAPEDPSRTGYTFEGWFTAETDGEEFDFDTEINKNFTLYAQWDARTVTGGVSHKHKYTANYTRIEGTQMHTADCSCGDTAESACTFVDGSDTCKYCGGQYVQVVAKIGQMVYASLAEALDAAVAGDTVTLADDIKVSAQITIDKAITIDGDGYSITAENFTGNTNDTKMLLTVNGMTDTVSIQNLVLDSANAAFGMQAYQSKDVRISNVTTKNSAGAGLIVNGSTVTAEKLTAMGNAWGSVNIDKGEPSFTCTDCDLQDSLQIWSEPKKAEVVVDKSEKYHAYEYTTCYVWSESTVAELFATYDTVTLVTDQDVSDLTDHANKTLIVADEAFISAEEGAVINVTVLDTSGEQLIYNATQLRAFADSVNGGNTYKDKTVKLSADIDLENVAWTPIGNVNSYPSVTFAGTFDGQEHTISNMSATDKTAGNASAGFFGSITGQVMNLIIDKATVISSHYAGGIVGYSSTNGMKIENCKVTNSTITSIPELISGSYDNGDKAGGIIGNMVDGDVVTGCTVENTTITAYRDLGGIAGNCDGTLSYNTVNKVTLIQDNTNGYKDSVTTIGKIYGRTANNTVVDDNNTATDVRIVVEGAADTVGATLKTLIKNNDEVEVELPAGEYTLPTTISSASAPSGKEITISGTSNTVIDLTNAVTAADSSVTFDGITVKVDGAGIYRGIKHAEKVVYRNCTLNGTQFLYSDAEYTNCTFNVTGDAYNIWTYGNDVTFTGCTFNCDGKAVLVYNEGAVTAEVTFNNCEFNDNGGLQDEQKAAVEVGESAYGNEATYTININDCTVSGFAITEQKPETSGGTNLGTTVWGNKNLMDADHLHIFIDNVKVY